jgi:hypothetical protein
MRNSKIAVVLVGPNTGQPGVLVSENNEASTVNLFLPNVEPDEPDDNQVYEFQTSEIMFIEKTFIVDLNNNDVLFHQTIK